MKKTIPLVQFEEEGANYSKKIEQVRDVYKRVLDIMATKVEEADIMKMFNYVMKEHPEVFVMAYDSVTANPNTGLFSVYLEDMGSQKIMVIKEVRSITGLGLKEAKDLVESAPVMMWDKVTKETAEDHMRRLIDIGARVRMDPMQREVTE